LASNNPNYSFLDISGRSSCDGTSTIHGVYKVRDIFVCAFYLGMWDIVLHGLVYLSGKKTGEKKRTNTALGCSFEESKKQTNKCFTTVGLLPITPF